MLDNSGSPFIPFAMDANRMQLRAWLTQVLEQTKETPTGLARKAGLAQSTLTRFLGNDDAPLLGLRSITKIANAARMPPPGIGFDRSFESITPASRVDTEAHLLADHIQPTELMTSIVELIKRNRPSADAWILNTDVLKLAGYMPGDILIVDLGTQPVAGNVVCAQAYQWANGTAETIFRIYEPPYLVAATDDSAARRPLLVDDNHVVIKGAVTESFRFSKA